MKNMSKIILSLLCMASMQGLSAKESKNPAKEPLIVQEQGSFFVGGNVLKDSKGNLYHADHAYVFYQKPPKPRKLPLVLLHGISQSSKTWESTPDGREGFQNIFLRQNFSTYNLTHPRRGNAGRSSDEAIIKPIFDEESWYIKWRIGVYPQYFKGVQFPQDKESLNQYMRQMTPNIGKIDFDMNAKSIATLFDKLKGAIMVAHSQGVMHTWKTIPKTDNIKAVVGLEGGGFFSFPNDEPSPKTEADEGIEYIMVSPKVFKHFTKMPILLIYGDNIPTTKSNIKELDIWRIRLDLARAWANAVNQRGGDVRILHLPEIGIYGNTHFPMQDLNNLQIADIIASWLKEKGLD